MDELRIPYPDFKMGDIIDPEQHDLNNGFIQTKVNEFVDFVNNLTSGGSGELPIIPQTPFTATTLQTLFDEIIARLKSTADGISGAKFVGSPTLVKLAGNDVEAQLKALDAMLQQAYVVTSSIANGAVTSDKVASNAIITDKIAPNSIVTAKVADLNITESKVAQSAITTPKIAPLAVTEEKLALGSVGVGNIKSNSVTSEKIADRTITGAKIATGIIKTEHLDPALINAIPQTVLSARVVALEEDVEAMNGTLSVIDRDLSDYEYQLGTVVGRELRLTRLGNTGRLPFNLTSELPEGSAISVSLNNGASSLPLMSVDGEAVTAIPKGFGEVVASGSFFTLVNKGGSLTNDQLQALIDIVNETEANESVLKTNYIDAVNAANGSINLPSTATWNDILLQIPNINVGTRKFATGTSTVSTTTLTFAYSDGSGQVSTRYLEYVGNLGFTPSLIKINSLGAGTTTYNSIYENFAGFNHITPIVKVFSQNGATLSSATNRAFNGNTENVYANSNGFRIPISADSGADCMWIAYE